MRVPTIDRGEGAASPWGRPRPAEESIRIVPQEAPLAGLVVGGTLLTLLTFGIYRFWYRTRLRRYYWGNTTVLGDGFDYTGTGRELLVGFLIMLAIFVPLNFAASLVGLFAGENVGGILSGVIALLILPAFIQIAIYRARGYRLARTRFRGVRFHQTGTGTGFLITTAKWLILTILSLGICYPYLSEAMHRYRVENTHFGSLQAETRSSAKVLMKPWLLVWTVLVILLVMVGAVAVTTALALSEFAIGVELLIAACALAVLPILWQNYRVAEFRHFVSTTRFGALTLSSDASARSVIWITVKYLVILAVTMLGLGIVLGILLFGSLGAMSNLFDEEAFSLGGGLGVVLIPLALLIAYALVTELYFRRRLWAHYAGSISLTNTSQLASIIQRAGQDGGAFGDSFDPGFDIAG